MEDNPYIALVKRITSEILANLPTTYRLGRVISIEPLKVEVENLQYDKDELLKSSNINQFYLGEELLLIPIEEEQRYIIVAKVVDV